MNSDDRSLCASPQASSNPPMSTRLTDKHSKQQQPKETQSKFRNDNHSNPHAPFEKHSVRPHYNGFQRQPNRNHRTRFIDKQLEGLRLGAVVPPLPGGINPLPLIPPLNPNSMAAVLAAASTYSSSSAALASSAPFPAATFCCPPPQIPPHPPPPVSFNHSTFANPASFHNHLVLAQAAARVVNPLQVKNLLNQSIALQQQLHRMVGPINFVGHNYHPVEQPSPSSPSVNHAHGSSFSSPSSASSSSSPSPSSTNGHITARHLVSSRLLGSRSLTLANRRPSSNPKVAPILDGPLPKTSSRRPPRQIHEFSKRIRDSVSCPSLNSFTSTSDGFSSDSCQSNYDDFEDLSSDRQSVLSTCSTPIRGSCFEDRGYARASSVTSDTPSRASSTVSRWDSFESISSEASDVLETLKTQADMKRHHEQNPQNSYGSSLSRSNNQTAGKRNRNLTLNSMNRGGNGSNRSASSRISQEPERAAAKTELDDGEKRERELQVNGPARTGSGTATGGSSSSSPSGGSVTIASSTHSERLREGIELSTTEDAARSSRHMGSGDAPTRVEKKNQSVRVPSSPPRPHSSPPNLTSFPFTRPGEQTAGSAYEIRQNSVRSSASPSSSVARVATPPPPSSSDSQPHRLPFLHPSQQQHSFDSGGCGRSSASSLGGVSGRIGLSAFQQNVPLQQQQQRCLSDDASSKKAVPSASSSGCSSIASSPSPPFMMIDRHMEISRNIIKFYDTNVQTNDLFTKKMQLRQAIYSIIKDVFPYCGLYVVGSSMNGFGGVKSDMDMCLMICQQEIDQHREAPEILRLIYRGLKKCAYIVDLELIRAKVPILKFKDDISGVECDLNVNNSVGIRNTHLLSFYSKADWRVRPLVMMVKHWAKIQTIGDASRRTISSYSLELMTIHFLQVGCTPPILPCLQKEFQHMFDPDCDIRSLSLNDELPAPFSTKNTQLIGELFVLFLDYYSRVFNFERDAISVRLGRAVPKEVVQYYGGPKNSPHMWKSLCIEEPFDRTNTARSVYDPMVFDKIIDVFRLSHDKLVQTGDLNSILGPEPFLLFDHQVHPP